VIVLLFPVPLTTTSEYAIVGVAQLSVAVAEPLVAAGKMLVLHSIVRLAGDKVNTGLVVSVTVIV
jgi:hypothetical protein